jgi:uncharacterized protein
LTAVRLVERGDGCFADETVALRARARQVEHDERILPVDTMVFINLPVADLERSKTFYEALGYSINPDFTDETAACVVVSDTISVMILTHAKFAEFTDKTIADTGTIEVINSLSAESKDAVHRVVDAAVMAGGTEDRPEIDLGFMYQRSFLDPDGHRWEHVWMDPQAMQDGPPSA